MKDASEFPFYALLTVVMFVSNVLRRDMPLTCFAFLFWLAEGEGQYCLPERGHCF